MELHAISTWYDQRDGVIAVEDDVLNVVRAIRAIDSRIHVYYDERAEQFNLVEHCLDGVERLIFSVKDLDARVVTRLREGDTWRDGNPDHPVPDDEDFLTRMETDQEQLWADKEAASLEKVGDAGERFAWALGDGALGPGYKQSIQVTKDISNG